jgi:cell shape-determining protein MreD
MTLWVTVAQVAAGVNVVLLLALTYVWGRNYAKFRSKHTLGLLVFALLLLAENVGIVYYYLLDPTLSAWWHNDSLVPAIVWQWQMAIHVIEAVGLSFLAWTAWD